LKKVSEEDNSVTVKMELKEQVLKIDKIIWLKPQLEREEAARVEIRQIKHKTQIHLNQPMCLLIQFQMLL